MGRDMQRHMSSYVVLARKWRPQQLADLTGQAHVAQTLTNALEQGRVPHALLFTGARGVGKTSCARILAMALNCANGPTAHPCGECPACTEIQRSQAVDVLEIDGASNRGINEIRELRDGVRYAPNRDRYKVYIIDEVHMLTNEAFNALLKTLEEPPPHVVFIFATTEAQKIPVTILSRCQRFDFKRIPHADIVKRLRLIADAEKLDIDDEVLGIVARQAAGGMRDALSLLDQVIAFAGTTVSIADAESILGAAERRRLFELSRALLARDVEGALRVVDDVDAFGVDLPHFSMELVEHLRDLAVVAVTSDPEVLTSLTPGEIGEARQQLAQTDLATVHRMFELMVEAAESIARSNHPKLILEMTIVRLTALEPAASIASLAATLERLANGEALPAPPASAARETAASPVSRPPAATAVTRPPEALEPTPEPQRAPEPPLETPERQPAPEPPLETPEPQPAPEPPPETPELQPAPKPPQETPEPRPAGSDVSTSDEARTPEDSDGTGLSAEAWTKIVNVVRDEAPHSGELLAKARAVSDGGVVRLGLSDVLVQRVSPELLDRLNQIASELGSGTVQFTAVHEDELEDDDLATSYHVVGVEAAERAARAEAARVYVETHEGTALLSAHFPGTRITNIEALESNNEEET
jgi:DNA polymerase-3 subunit gamma/tau